MQILLKSVHLEVVAHVEKPPLFFLGVAFFPIPLFVDQAPSFGVVDREIEITSQNCQGLIGREKGGKDYPKSQRC